MAEKIHTLYSEHSYAACISEGFQFLAKQLLLVTIVMLPYLTVTALFTVLSIGYNTKLNVAIAANMEVTLTDIFIAILLFTIAYAAYCISTGRMFLMFRLLTGAEIVKPEDFQKQSNVKRYDRIKRSMQITLWGLPYLIWPYLINVPGFPILETLKELVTPLATEWQITIVCGATVLFIIFVYFAAPLLYTFYCRMMRPSFIDTSTEEGKRYADSFGFKKAYKDGLNNNGKIIGVTLLSGFIVIISSLILLLPGIVSIEAYFSSIESSVNFGDTTLIPTGGYVLMIISSTVALSFAYLLSITLYASLLYLHGDIYHKSAIPKKQ